MVEADASRRDWIRAHQVTWEREPHYELCGASRIRTGYHLSLFARHPATVRGDPGCAECVHIHQELHALARAALPESSESSVVSFSPRLPVFALRPESDWMPEVELDVDVYQPGGVTASDEDEAACIVAMEGELRRLGARRGAWSCLR